MTGGDRSQGGWVFTTVGGELFIPWPMSSLKAERLAEDFCQRVGWPSPSTQRFLIPAPVAKAKPQRRQYRGRATPRRPPQWTAE